MHATIRACATDITHHALGDTMRVCTNALVRLLLDDSVNAVQSIESSKCARALYFWAQRDAASYLFVLVCVRIGYK